MTIEETEQAYVRRDGQDLLSVVYRPDAASRQPVPVVIDVHGGAWSSGHRKSGRYYDRALAEAGICVVAIDFRQGPDHKHPAAIEDIADAVRWAKKDLGVESTGIGLIGSSSGGHLALFTALNPDTHGSRTDVSAAVDHVIALWPVSNPIARYQYATARLHEDPSTFVRFAPERLKAGHEAYFVDERQMAEAAIQHILVSKTFSHLPRIFVVQPELDENVPVLMSQTLAGAWELAGGEVDYTLYEGVAHAFAHAEGEKTDECIADMIEFIREVS